MSEPGIRRKSREHVCFFTPVFCSTSVLHGCRGGCGNVQILFAPPPAELDHISQAALQLGVATGLTSAHGG